MAIYEWECRTCETATETIQSYLDPPPMCPYGHGPMRRLMSVPAPPLMGGLEGKLRSGAAVKKRNETYCNSPLGKEEHRAEIKAAHKRLGIP